MVEAFEPLLRIERSDIAAMLGQNCKSKFIEAGKVFGEKYPSCVVGRWPTPSFEPIDRKCVAVNPAAPKAEKGATNFDGTFDRDTLAAGLLRIH